MNLTHIAASLLCIIPAIALHEFGHAAMATKLGDPTPRSQGRLTLNPAAHFDPFGLIMIVMTVVTGFGLGWGKPVITNPMYFRNVRQGLILVALAGPAMNLCQASLAIALTYIMYLAHVPFSGFIQTLLLLYILINFGLMLFNLIPLPPLDGGNVLINLLPLRYGETLRRMTNVTFFIMLGLLWTGVLGGIIGFFQSLIFQAIAAIFGYDYIAYLTSGF